MATDDDAPAHCPFCGYPGCVICPPPGTEDVRNGPAARRDRIATAGAATGEGRFEDAHGARVQPFEELAGDAMPARRTLHTTRAGVGRVGVLRRGQ